MTQAEFDSAKFRSSSRVIYRGAEYRVVSVNFHERLLGLPCGDDDEDLIWVRCENVEVVE